MDKNTIIGIILCIAIFIGFSIYNRPSQEEIQHQKRLRDSAAAVMKQKYEAELEQQKLRDSLAKNNTEETLSEADSAQRSNYAASFGDFSKCAFGEKQEIVLQNEKIKVKLSSKGAKISSVEVLGYKTYSGEALTVIKDDPQNEMGFDFFCGSKAVSTKNLYFEYNGYQKEISATKDSPAKAVLRAKVNEDSWLEFAYSLENDSYLLDYTITFHKLENVVNRNSSYIDFTWNQYLPVLERGNKWESQHSGLYYKYDDESSEYLSLTSDNDAKNLTGSLKWIAYKGEFFSSVLISKTDFPNADVSFQNVSNNGNFKFMSSKIGFSSADTSKAMAFYFGPNQFKILKDITLAENEDLGLQELVPLGWGIFGWINRYAIIPLFNWLGSFISSYGLIILIMTIIIKVVIFPLTYKSYKSTASMRVLKPQIEEINKKYPKQEQAMQKQQAIMALYKKVGISPLGGCMPLLLQMPILIAMFNFFPASIELRQQSFLWATDLSSYDSILDLTLSIPWYGEHVSLFTVLMAIAMVVSTKINSSQMDTGQQQMPGMKMMMYLMPVMMVFWFNDYSSGLSYYYFLSNIITIIQMMVIRRTLDENALLEKLNSKAAKNSAKKKTGFLARLEEAQRQQLEAMKKQQKRK